MLWCAIIGDHIRTIITAAEMAEIRQELLPQSPEIRVSPNVRDATSLRSEKNSAGIKAQPLTEVGPELLPDGAHRDLSASASRTRNTAAIPLLWPAAGTRLYDVPDDVEGKNIVAMLRLKEQDEFPDVQSRVVAACLTD